jgi:hypothetical protein
VLYTDMAKKVYTYFYKIYLYTNIWYYRATWWKWKHLLQSSWSYLKRMIMYLVLISITLIKHEPIKCLHFFFFLIYVRLYIGNFFFFLIAWY